MIDMLAYIVWPRKQKGYYFENAPEDIFCPKCGTCTEQNYVPNVLNIRLGKLDIVATYDKRYLVSEKFRAFCTHSGIADVEFCTVTQNTDAYLVVPNTELQIDTDRTGTRFVDRCEVCGSYESIVGATPAFLKNINAPILNGLFKSDLKFGSGREKSPLLIAGIETKAKLEASDLQGMEFEGIES